MPFKFYREIEISLLVAYLDRGNVFSQCRKFFIDAALFEEVSGSAVEVHRRAYEV